jgi:hypothetical protein
MFEWASLTIGFSGWSLTEVKEMSPRERANWIQVAKGLGRLGKGKE